MAGMPVVSLSKVLILRTVSGDVAAACTVSGPAVGICTGNCLTDCYWSRGRLRSDGLSGRRRYGPVTKGEIFNIFVGKMWQLRFAY